jgi:hypothetical protein
VKAAFSEAYAWAPASIAVLAAAETNSTPLGPRNEISEMELSGYGDVS